ncbi:MAG: 3-oxoadipate enol-lactonase PcaD [Saliniramus fredricksonii]|uniref:3-oxoadipate enol-lactonase n=1 Tax=Saliniramus fredricksonii TaxID=1653334 RepID=A0A0P7Y6V0_9HYPH|nr:3-oxoadipate enol-lactonase [Saliniramus fredricksonii]KPQ09982.1 MAG: 3-oxoadipate enol-lactonase PcaD [Saliniramus fredricksonii]SCC80827.1 3-oxoadipate enol-lactonase [Saliniramus fredricksonii]
MMDKINVAGRNFRVAIDGPDDAPPLMLSNSLATNLAMWDAQMPALAAHFRVIRYDHRGHGASDAPQGPYSFAGLAEDAVGILDALGIEKAHWCGLSMGGMTGMRMLTHHRERIGRAVLANTAAQMGTADVWNSRAETARAQGMSVIAGPTLERWFTPEFRESDPQAVGRVREMIHATPAQGYAACCEAIRDMDQRESIRAVEAPVLVVIGARDPSTTPEHGELIRDAITGAQAVTLDAAHLSNVERPEEFTRAVMDFLLER